MNTNTATPITHDNAPVDQNESSVLEDIAEDESQSLKDTPSKQKEPKWNYAHFPIGTIAEVFVRNVHKEPVQVEVTKVACNGIDSWLIYTTTPCTVTEYKMYNIEHVTRIIKRGPGEAAIATQDYPADLSYFESKPASRYVTYSRHSLVRRIAEKHLTPDQMLNNDKLVDLIIARGIFRRADSGENEVYIPYTASKKKLQRAIRQLLNKCLCCIKEEKRIDNEQERLRYERDMELDMERDSFLERERSLSDLHYYGYDD